MNGSPTEHNRYQLDYYRDADRRAIRPADTPYVRRHFRHVRDAGGLDSGERVLELGCGTGRFTRLLLDMGLRVTANDLSPTLLDALREVDGGDRLEILAGDLRELSEQGARRFDRAVGFFVLHHLYDLDAAFAALAGVLEPGARVAFCEPNGYNPLFYLQVLVSPSMTWKAERGIRRMTPRVVFGAMARNGFVDLDVRRYGFFPPWISNTVPGHSAEKFLERWRLLRPVRAFQVLSARLDPGDGRERRRDRGARAFPLHRRPR